MEIIQIAFGMPFKNQILPRDWDWSDFGPYYYNPNADYQSLAKRMLRDMPLDGPSCVSIKAGDRLVAIWSRYNERCELLGI